MTLGALLPLVTLGFALIEIPLFVRKLRELPTRTSLDYQENTPQHRTGLKVLIAASALLPVLLYLMLNVILPGIGEMQVFG